jgi:hypothetical protein
MITLVSSANIIVLRLTFEFTLIVTLGISFMYNKNSSGPSIDPCGTPCLTVPQLEVTLLLEQSLSITL